MRVLESQGGCLPSPEQLLFLRCCLSAPENTLALWREWQKNHTLDEIDQALYRLLPLLYRALFNAGYDGPEMPLLKGIYRRNWYCQKQVFHMLEPLLKAFREANIPTLMMKGTGLSQIFYPDPYTRYMADTDLMVPKEKLDAAVALMQRHGWTSPTKLPLSKQFKNYENACLFTNGKKEELDLHWHLFAESANYENDAPFWQRAMPLRINGETTLTFCATDHFLHTCIHGYRWNPLHPLRWIADAYMLASHPQHRIDWKQLVEEGWNLRMLLRLKSALELLKNERIIDIPESVFAHIATYPVMDFEKNEYEVVTNQNPSLSDPKRAVLWPLKVVWYLQRRRYVHDSPVWCVLTYPIMMGQYMHLRHMGYFLPVLARIVMKKLYYRYINRKG